MRRRLVVIASAALLVPAVGTATLVRRPANRSSAHETGRAPAAAQFVGYWMGIDPLGGDSRRGITTNNIERSP